MKELALKILGLYDKVSQLEEEIKEQREHLKEIKRRRDDAIIELVTMIYEGENNVNQ